MTNANNTAPHSFVSYISVIKHFRSLDANKVKSLSDFAEECIFVADDIRREIKMTERHLWDSNADMFAHPDRDLAQEVADLEKAAEQAHYLNEKITKQTTVIATFSARNGSTYEVTDRYLGCGWYRYVDADGNADAWHMLPLRAEIPSDYAFMIRRAFPYVSLGLTLNA